MSSRALRKLRGEDDHAILTQGLKKKTNGDDDDDSSSEDEEEIPKRNAFCFSDDDDDDSSEDDNSSSSSSSDDEGDSFRDDPNKPSTVEVKTEVKMNKVEEEKCEEENIDEILKEFNVDGNVGVRKSGGKANKTVNTGWNVILDAMDSRSMDMDYNLRCILGSEHHVRHEAAANDGEQGQRGNRAARRRGQQQQYNRRNRAKISKKLWFGKARDHWLRPPSMVGGGMGMEITTNNKDPYASLHDYEKANWYTFVYSDTYATMEAEFERVANSGDVNMLAMFVAQNPLCASALLQLAMVFVHTNNLENGTELLRRSIFIYEYACIPTLFGSFSERDTEINLMDADLPENKGFFSALFRLMQISCMVGCLETSLCISRFLLSLDPIRDPMGILLTLDYFTLATHNFRYLVDLVDSNVVKIYSEGVICKVTDLPNFAFNYALALWRLSQEEEDYVMEGDLTKKANSALKSALHMYPEVLTLLLEKAGVDVVGRSVQYDWPVVLSFLEASAFNGEKRSDVNHESTMHVVRIFVQRSYKLWSSEEVCHWIYDVCTDLISEGTTGSQVSERDSFSSASVRYSNCDPSDYEDKFKILPAEANPLDPALVQPALAMDPNRRLMRRNPQIDNNEFGADAVEMQRMLLDQLERNGGTIIDPDSPILEVFLQSLLPWAHVEGVNLNRNR